MSHTYSPPPLHAHSHENTVPRPALFMAGTLVVLSLVLTAAVTFGFMEREAVPQVERAKASVSAAEVRTLRFEDAPNGDVRVNDATNNELILLVQSDTQSGGFIRGVMRGMARERRLYGIGQELPFELTLWQDGSLSLNDLATGRDIELGGFGSDNRAVFIRLLKNGEAL
jgi:putative photosynthetic complex assembly protein